jgi:hypothetical protein
VYGIIGRIVQVQQAICVDNCIAYCLFGCQEEREHLAYAKQHVNETVLITGHKEAYDFNHVRLRLGKQELRELGYGRFDLPDEVQHVLEIVDFGCLYDNLFDWLAVVLFWLLVFLFVFVGVRYLTVCSFFERVEYIELFITIRSIGFSIFFWFKSLMNGMGVFHFAENHGTFCFAAQIATVKSDR